MAKEKITGIILSGGRSSRLGHEKGLAELNSKSLIDYSIEILKPVCDRIIISANTYLDEYAAFGYPVVKDEIKNIGPMGGLMACLKKSETQYNFVLSCDTPFVPSGLFAFLMDSIENFQVAIPVHHDNRFEPLCAVYATNVIWELQHCVENGTFKMINFIQKVNAKKVVIDDRLSFYHDEMFVNMNTKKDIENSTQND